MSDVHGVLTAQAELIEELTSQEPPPRRRWPYVVVALVVVAAALATVVLLRQDSGPSGPPHPSTWDPKVQKYVDFVEKARDLEFEHPVYVDFLPEEEFTEQVTSDPDELTDEDREAIDQANGLMRALGLVEGDVDLFEESNELSGSGIIGYYSYDDERLRVRGTELTPAVVSTLVHELTHALQDQSFDLGQRFEELAKSDDVNSSAASSGFKALVEGDARRIEAKWRERLPEKQRAALDKEQKRDSDGFEQKSKDIPEVLVTMQAAPYELGRALLDVAVQQGKDRAVDDLFRSPPRTEEQQLDPWTLIADHQGFLTVPTPVLADGEKALDEDDEASAFGSIGWLMVLSERLPVEQALTAVDGWGGDSSIAYERDGVSCMKANYRADTPEDLEQMQVALTDWLARTPKAPASVSRDSLTLTFQSCDPGKNAAKVATGKSMEALTLALSRTYLSLMLVKSGLDVPIARCGADKLVRGFTVAELRDPHPGPELMQRASQVLAPCRAQV